MGECGEREEWEEKGKKGRDREATPRGSCLYPQYEMLDKTLVTCVLCGKIKQCTANILIPHERAVTLVFRHQQWLADDAPSV